MRWNLNLHGTISTEYKYYTVISTIKQDKIFNALQRFSVERRFRVGLSNFALAIKSGIFNWKLLNTYWT